MSSYLYTHTVIATLHDFWYWWMWDNTLWRTGMRAVSVHSDSVHDSKTRKSCSRQELFIRDLPSKSYQVDISCLRNSDEMVLENFWTKSNQLAARIIPSGPPIHQQQNRYPAQILLQMWCLYDLKSHLIEGLEECGVIHYGPVGAPCRFAHFQSFHEGIHWSGNLGLVQGHWHVDWAHVHAKLLQ